MNNPSVTETNNAYSHEEGISHATIASYISMM
jgi:hypothetical protein